MSSRIFSSVLVGLTLISASQSFAGARELLAADLEKGIKTLPRETRLYHYFGINLNGKRLEDTNLRKSEERYKMVQNRLQAFASTFWDLDNHTTKLANSGLGLYLAVDPFSSSPAAAADTGANFGSTAIEVTINAGTKYLDLVDAVPLRVETIQAIVAETGMQKQDVKKLFEARKKGFYRDTLQFMAEPQNTGFRQIVHSVFSNLGIAMTEYGWQAGTSAFCNVATGSGKIHHSAFVYVGSPQVGSVIKSINMVYFDPANVQFDAQESESLARNQKLYDVLKNLRPLEKQYQSAAANKDKVSMKTIFASMKQTIDSVYTDPTEVQDLRLKTFDCIK
jgi:hypothetical protein